MDAQRGRNFRLVLDYELKKHLYRDFAKLGKGSNSAYGKHAVARGTASNSFEERLPCPTFESNTKIAMQNGVAWTLSLPPVTTAVEISPKKCAQMFALCSCGCYGNAPEAFGSA